MEKKGGNQPSKGNPTPTNLIQSTSNTKLLRTNGSYTSDMLGQTRELLYEQQSVSGNVIQGMPNIQNMYLQGQEQAQIPPPPNYNMSLLQSQQVKSCHGYNGQGYKATNTNSKVNLITEYHHGP